MAVAGLGWAGLGWLGWAGWAGGRVGAVIQAEFELKLDTGLMWHTEQLSTETSARDNEGISRRTWPRAWNSYVLPKTAADSFERRDGFYQILPFLIDICCLICLIFAHSFSFIQLTMTVWVCLSPCHPCPSPSPYQQIHIAHHSKLLEKLSIAVKEK